MWFRRGPSQRNILLRRKFLNLLNKIQQDEAASQVCDLSEFESVKNDLLNEEFWGDRVHRHETTLVLSQLIDALNECCVFAYQHLHQQQQQQKQSGSVKKSLARCVRPLGLLSQGRLGSKLQQIKEELQLSQPTEWKEYYLSEGRRRPHSSEEEDLEHRFYRGPTLMGEFEDPIWAFVDEESGKNGLAAVAIVGTGGSGKTTCARNIRGLFLGRYSGSTYRHIWLSLPSSKDTTIDHQEEFQIALLREMMKQIIDQNESPISPPRQIMKEIKNVGARRAGDDHQDDQNSYKVESMMRRIRQELIGKEYLIVIDDLKEDMPPGLFSWFTDLASNEVREGETFGDRLSHAFPTWDDQNGHRTTRGVIIVTSKVEDERVRKVVGSNHNILRLDASLTDGQCWLLVKDELEDRYEPAFAIAKQQKDVFLETCGGLPLAVAALAGAFRDFVSADNKEISKEDNDID